MTRNNKWRRVARQQQLIKQGGRCVYCYEPLIQGTLDHVHPQSKGGTDRKDNLVVACRACNQAKGAMSIGRFKKFIKNEITIHWARRKLFLRGQRAERKILKYVGFSNRETRNELHQCKESK